MIFARYWFEKARKAVICRLHSALWRATETSDIKMAVLRRGAER